MGGDIIFDMFRDRKNNYIWKFWKDIIIPVGIQESEFLKELVKSF